VDHLKILDTDYQVFTVLYFTTSAVFLCKNKVG